MLHCCFEMSEHDALFLMELNHRVPLLTFNKPLALYFWVLANRLVLVILVQIDQECSKMFRFLINELIELFKERISIFYLHTDRHKEWFFFRSNLSDCINQLKSLSWAMQNVWTYKLCDLSLELDWPIN